MIDLRNTKFQAHMPKDAESFQVMAFANGVTWCTGHNHVQHAEQPFFFIDSHKHITHCNGRAYFESHAAREVVFDQYGELVYAGDPESSNLRDVKFRVPNPETSKSFQKQAFDAGADWGYSDTTATVQHTDKPFLFINKDGGITFGVSEDHFQTKHYTEVFWDVIHKQIVFDAPDEGMKFDSDKPQFGLIPPKAELSFAKVLTHGAKKYAPDNWRKVEQQRYVDAMMRHLNAYRNGESNDPETGEPHMAHIMCCAAFILELDNA